MTTRHEGRRSILRRGARERLEPWVEARHAELGPRRADDFAERDEARIIGHDSRSWSESSSATVASRWARSAASCSTCAGGMTLRSDSWVIPLS